jgi:hypothetical protein
MSGLTASREIHSLGLKSVSLALFTDSVHFRVAKASTIRKAEYIAIVLWRPVRLLA